MAINFGTLALALLLPPGRPLTGPAQHVARPRHAALRMEADVGTSIRAVLSAQPGWASGKGVTVQGLYDQCAPPDEDAFFDAIDALEVDGWLLVQNGATDDEDDLLFAAVAVRAANAKRAINSAKIFSGTFKEAKAAEEASASAMMAELVAERASREADAAAAAAEGVGAVQFDRERAEQFDYEAESAAAAGVLQAVAGLKRFGVDKGDERGRAGLAAVCR